MDAWYRHFEKDCSHSLAIDYEFSPKERVRRGAFDMHSFFTKPGTKQEAMACPMLTSLVLGRISSRSISSAADGAKRCHSGGSVAGA